MSFLSILRFVWKYFRYRGALYLGRILFFNDNEKIVINNFDEEKIDNKIKLNQILERNHNKNYFSYIYIEIIYKTYKNSSLREE